MKLQKISAANIVQNAFLSNFKAFMVISTSPEWYFSWKSHAVFLLSLTVFFHCTGAVIMYGAFLLFDQDFVHVMSITFTSLILTELLMVALTIRTWHWMMVVGELISLAAYIATLVVLRKFFGKNKL